MPVLLIDTETTGKINKKAPINDASQPHLVQLAAVLCDDDLRELASMNVLVYPFDWIISEEVAAFHGITHERAADEGVGLRVALSTLKALASQASRVVAHNIEFDDFIISRASNYIAEVTGEKPVDIFEGMEKRCTMRAATKLLKIKTPYMKHDKDYKFASLSETYKYFFNETFDGAHDAINDVRAMIRVYGPLCEHYGIQP